MTKQKFESKFKVGDKIIEPRYDKNEFIQINYIGKEYFIGVDEKGKEYSEAYKNYQDNHFQLYQEPKPVPFNFETIQPFRDKWIKNKSYNYLIRITGIYPDLITHEGDVYSYNRLLDDFEFEDGSPCGLLKQ